MKNIIQFFKDSNHYKHLIGGFILGLLSNSIYCAILTGSSVAAALEYKDKLWGGKFDWIDLIITLIGTGLGYLIHFYIFQLF